MKRILLVDDKRSAVIQDPKEPTDAHHFVFDPGDRIIICRDYFSAIEVLQNLPQFDRLLLDRDLRSFDDQGREMTGEDVLGWLENHRDKVPRDIQIVTANLVARPRLEVRAYQ